MSGHSKWATTHRQKEIKDAARGQLFTKLARAITIAAKVGGGPVPDSNYKLKIAIEKARAVSMPKENIDRAISKANQTGELTEVTYEGFAPSGVGVIVEVATDNRNRTAQEIKNIFERGGGSMAGPGAVSFNFEPKELILVKKQNDWQNQILSLMDLGVDDVNEREVAIEVFTDPTLGHKIRKKMEDLGMEVSSSELVQKPKNIIAVEDPHTQEKIMNLLETLNAHDDVQKVFSNI